MGNNSISNVVSITTVKMTKMHKKKWKTTSSQRTSRCTNNTIRKTKSMTRMLELYQYSLRLILARQMSSNRMHRKLLLNRVSNRQLLKPKENSRQTRPCNLKHKIRIVHRNTTHSDHIISKSFVPPFLTLFLLISMDPQSKQPVVTMHDYITQDQSQRVAQQQ